MRPHHLSEEPAEYVPGAALMLTWTRRSVPAVAGCSMCGTACGMEILIGVEKRKYTPIPTFTLTKQDFILLSRCCNIATSSTMPRYRDHRVVMIKAYVMFDNFKLRLLYSDSHRRQVSTHLPSLIDQLPANISDSPRSRGSYLGVLFSPTSCDELPRF